MDTSDSPPEKDEWFEEYMRPFNPEEEERKEQEEEQKDEWFE